MWSPRIVICRSSRIAQSAGPLPNTGEITLRNLHDLAEALRLIGFRGQSKHLMWRPTLRAAYRSLPVLSQAKTISTLNLPKFTQGSFSKLSPSLGANLHRDRQHCSQQTTRYAKILHRLKPLDSHSLRHTSTWPSTLNTETHKSVGCSSYRTQHITDLCSIARCCEEVCTCQVCCTI